MEKVRLIVSCGWMILDKKDFCSLDDAKKYAKSECNEDLLWEFIDIETGNLIGTEKC